MAFSLNILHVFDHAFHIFIVYLFVSALQQSVPTQFFLDKSDLCIIYPCIFADVLNAFSAITHITSITPQNSYI